MRTNDGSTISHASFSHPVTASRHHQLCDVQLFVEIHLYVRVDVRQIALVNWPVTGTSIIRQAILTDEVTSLVRYNTGIHYNINTCSAG